MAIHMLEITPEEFLEKAAALKGNADCTIGQQEQEEQEDRADTLEEPAVVIPIGTIFQSKLLQGICYLTVINIYFILEQIVMRTMTASYSSKNPLIGSSTMFRWQQRQWKTVIRIVEMINCVNFSVIFERLNRQKQIFSEPFHKFPLLVEFEEKKIIFGEKTFEKTISKNTKKI